MALTFNKFNSFVEALAEKVHNLGSDQLRIALTAGANPPVAGNSQLSNLTQISLHEARTTVDVHHVHHHEVRETQARGA